MFRSILVILLSLSYLNIAKANCTDDILGARYKITTSDINGKHKNTSHLTLWRDGNQVAHEHKDTGITEVWEKLKNGQLRLIKYFDKYKQGIEYEPNEIKIKHTITSWQLKKQLIAQSLIDNMQFVSTSKKGCDVSQQYKNKNSKETVRLEWLFKQKLVNNLTIKSNKGTVSWQLESIITDAKKVKNLFSQHAGYKTTDYADVGDNESDPFLSKMINMGFVSHGASGMYNQNGQLIEGGHGH